MQNNPVTQPEKKNISKPHLYFWLFSINLFISAFTFGGGYVVVPMIRKYFVEQKKLFDEDELMNMAAVAQSVPGAIAINLSALAGYRCAGTAGVLISCLASILPLIFCRQCSHCRCSERDAGRGRRPYRRSGDRYDKYDYKGAFTVPHPDDTGFFCRRIYFSYQRGCYSGDLLYPVRVPPSCKRASHQPSGRRKG